MQSVFSASDSILRFALIKLHELCVSHLGVKGVVLSVVLFCCSRVANVHSRKVEVFSVSVETSRLTMKYKQPILKLSLVLLFC